MVIKSAHLFALAIVSAISISARARTATHIHITMVGQSFSDDDKFAVESCNEHFRPSEQQLRHYFQHAYPVERYFGNSPRYSQCYATGTVEFSDGNHGEWIINSGGAGGITWPEGDSISIFFKHNKWVDPFSCTYGLSDALEC